MLGKGTTLFLHNNQVQLSVALQFTKIVRLETHTPPLEADLSMKGCGNEN
jgi:hypothetical protein